MTVSQPSSAVRAWRVAIIGVVGALAIVMGVAVSSFLLQSRVSMIGSGASYVPATAPMYVEVRIEPSAAQDASLRELLGRFPEIDGVDLARPLYEQLTEKIDEEAAGETDLSWSEDVASWFDGRIGFAMLDFPVEAMMPTDLSAMPPVPSMVALFGVEDRAAAETAVGRLRDEAGSEVTFTEQEHAGVSIQVADADQGFAYALTDDQLIIAPAAGDIVAALDAHGSSDTTLSEAASITRLTDELPADWLVFAFFDFTDVMAAALDSPAASPGADVLRELMENQPLRGAMALTADGDRVTFETASDAPGGAMAVTNADRGLADEVPADTLYFADGGNVGASLAAVIGPLKEAMAQMPGGQDQVDTLEAALGGDIEELVDWIGDAATAVGFDGEQLWGGLVIAPTDVAAARETMNKLGTFAGLAMLDPSIGITVEEREVDAGTITSVRWSGAPTLPGSHADPELVVEWIVTDDRAVIGIGDRFVERALGLEAAESLAEVARYRDAVAELGGPSNAGVTWIDLRGVIDELEAFYAADVAFDIGMSTAIEWLMPFDRVVGVARLQGDVLVSSVVLLVE